MLPPTNSHHRRSSHGLGTLVVLTVCVALAGLATANRQDIIDWWRLRSYQAPPAIALLADEDGMTAYGQKIFYVNQPNVLDKFTFSRPCPNDGREQTIVLGCYHSNQAGIFLLRVTDPRLNGVQQVTAAHEMLHGAYDRLSPKERLKVDALLSDYYKNDLHDARVLSTIDAYKKSEPKDVINEMHSIFGSEIATLPRDLENYYKRYFNNRPQVAAYAAQYQSEFKSRREIIAQDDTRLADLKQRIATIEADLKTKKSEIVERQRDLDAERNSGDIVAYNAGVPTYNGLLDNYNSELQQVNTLIEQYNQLLASRNQIALEQNQLFKELDSNTRPINH